MVMLDSKMMDMELGTISNADGLMLAQEAAKDPKGFTVDFPASPRLYGEFEQDRTPALHA